MTQEEIDGWTDEQVNVAVAEAMGWIDVVYDASGQRGERFYYGGMPPHIAMGGYAPLFLTDPVASDSLIDTATANGWDYAESTTGSGSSFGVEYTTNFFYSWNWRIYAQVAGTDRRRVRATAFLLAHHAQKERGEG